MNISSVIYTGATNTRNPIQICIHTQPINYDGRPNLIPVYETNRQQPYDPTGEIQKSLFSGVVGWGRSWSCRVGVGPSLYI